MAKAGRHSVLHIHGREHRAPVQAYCPKLGLRQPKELTQDAFAPTGLGQSSARRYWHPSTIPPHFRFGAIADEARGIVARRNRPWLREAQMVWIGWLPSADNTGL